MADREERAPRKWVPGDLFVSGHHLGGATLLRRRLLDGAGRPFCDVFEACCSSHAEAAAYLRDRGDPARCPPPWGDGPRPKRPRNPARRGGGAGAAP